MKLGAQFVLNVNIYNCILIFSFSLMCLISPKLHNHAVYINFALNH